MYFVTTTVYDHTLRVTQTHPCDHHRLRLDGPVVLESSLKSDAYCGDRDGEIRQAEDEFETLRMDLRDDPSVDGGQQG